ncbi:MAG TPA: S9 family peptidase [Micromonosporaceae bacterium]
MKPSDLALLRTLSAPTLSPDGRFAVVAVTRPDLDADDYTGQLWLVPTDGSAPPRQLTHGWRDSAPQWSPDGAWLAFVRAERDRAGKVDKPQLYVMPTAGGEPRRLTDHPLGVTGAVWSPDSTRLAYLARVPEAGRYGTTEGVGPEKEPPRRLTTFSYRFDGIGFVIDRRTHIWTVSVDSPEPEPVQITQGDHEHADVSWSPSGDLLAFVTARHDNRDVDRVSDVWVCRPDGGDARQVTRGGLSVADPRFTPDGAAICFLGEDAGPDGRSVVARNMGVWSVPTDGSQPPRRLTDAEKYTIGYHTTIEVTPDGVLFPTENRGAVDLVRVPFDGGEPEVLIAGRRQVLGAVEAGGVLAASVADPARAGEVTILAEGRERTVTDFGAEFSAAVDVRPMDEIEATAPDGYPVHGWVVRPSGDGPHPVLLMIHGGPFTQYGYTLFDEAQVYAGAGYAVVMGNPRGSSGYGEAHGRAILGNVGEASARDLLALLDAALTADDLDASRVGVLGGSHGGYMTTWLAAHHGERFKAAVSERAVNAIDSFVGSSDIGWFFADNLYGTDPAQRAAQSPLAYADRIRIPMLIIHSEQDWRCPLEQAQRLFVALKSAGTDTEMLLFPGEGHELSRSGLPSHRVARFDAIVEWFGRYL